MPSNQPTKEILDWLNRNGWFPGRDIGDSARDLIQVRLQDAESQGFPLEVVEAAARVIRAYGLLDLKHPRASHSAFEMEPTGGYDGDAREIAEMAAALGVPLFPVGFESSELGIILVDKIGRWFLLHHTGGYFLGEDAHEAFSRFITNAETPDAEDFYV
ncbi:SUKH-3 domain-containing protein [Streptomyces sp. NPDC002431]